MSSNSNGYSWSLEWFVLGRVSLASYTDKDHVETGSVKTVIKLKGCTCVVGLAEPSAPGRSAEYCKQQPYGFVLDVDPSLSPEHRFFYFDAQDSESVKAWISAVKEAVNHICTTESGFNSSGINPTGNLENPIDDYSDYEDDSQEKRSSLVSRHQKDWRNVQTSPTSSHSRKSTSRTAAFDIDDFSDYEDDEAAKRSSLVAGHDIDWARLDVPPVAQSSAEVIRTGPAPNADLLQTLMQ